MKRTALAALLLSGCSVMSDQRVEGWPTLEVIERHVPHAEMQARCGKYVGFGMSPIACAEFYLSSGKCLVWFSADVPPPQFVVTHERAHCAGFDHVGSTAMRDLLRRTQ